MSRRRRRRRRIWPVILIVIVVIILLLLFAGGKFLKHTIAKTAAKQMITQQVQESGSSEASDIVNRMSEEDLDTATGIAEKYISLGKMNEYMKAWQSDDLSKIKEELKQSMSQEDLDTLRSLYEKYR